jgi:serine/threonine-protein kinase
MSEGKYEEACPKLAESHRLDPGGGTILNLAVCHAAQGRYASAWSEFREAVDIARTDGRKDREEFALKELAKVEPKLSYLTVVVDRPAETPGMIVTLDGENIQRVAWGAPFPIDPGVHEVVASAPGRKDRRATVHIESSGDSKAVSIAVLEIAPRPARELGASAAPSLPPAAPVPAVASEAPARRAPVSVRRTAGFVIGGAGIVALGAGATVGVWALQKRSESDDYCKGDVCSEQRGVDLNDDAKQLANYANVSVGVGVLAVLAGTYLVLSDSSASTNPDARTHRPAPAKKLALLPLVAPEAASLGVSGTW